MSTGAAIIGALRVVFGADTAAFEKGADEVTRKTRKLERQFVKTGEKFQKVGKNLSIGITAPILALGVASTKTAIDMQELESAFDVTFGSASETVRKWATETGDALGRSTREIQESAVAFQSLFGKALDADAATELSKKFSVLTQDLASFKNLSNDVAQQKLFSGLTGEAEPLRSVGVFINEAAVSAKALELGLDKVNGKYTDQQKIVARAALIQEQLSDATGDVTRTFDSAQNQLKRSAAAFEELRVVIGTKLIPVLTPLIEKIADALTWFANLPDPVINTTIAIAGIAAAIGPVIAAIGSLITVFGPLLAGVAATTGATTALGAAITIATGPIGLITIALGGLFLAYKTLGPAIIGNKDALSDLYSLISENESLSKREKASTIDQARLNLEEAKSIRERIKARLEEQEVTLKKQVKGFVAVNATPGGRALGRLGINKKITGNIKATADAINASRKALDDNASATAKIEKNLISLGGTVEGTTTTTKVLTKAQIAAKQKAEEMAKAAKKLAEAHTEATADAKAQIDENLRLAAALQVSQKEYDITAASIDLVKDGYRGTKEEIRELATAIVESEAVMQAAEDARQAEIQSQNDATAAIKKNMEAKREAAKALQENHDNTVAAVEKEIETNKILTDALRISTREYEIQVEILNLLDSGYQGSAESARAYAEQLVTGNETLAKVREETEKTEEKLRQAGKTGVDAFTATADSFTNLLGAIKGGDLEGILGGVLNIFKQFQGGDGGGGGIFDGILSGVSSIFGGFRENGGPVSAGISYVVGERGPELFTPSTSGKVIPNGQMTGTSVKLMVESSPYFNATVDERASAVADPISQVASTQGITQYNKSTTRRNNQRLA